MPSTKSAYTRVTRYDKSHCEVVVPQKYKYFGPGEWSAKNRGGKKCTVELDSSQTVNQARANRKSTRTARPTGASVAT